MKPIDQNSIIKLNDTRKTIANDAQQKMNISISRAKDSLTDNAYWTVETITKAEGLGDISIAPRRTVPFGRPSAIFAAQCRDGVVNVLKRKYPDKLKEGWQVQFTLGDGISTAIAFDGYWEYYNGLWRLCTSGDPYITWVDSSGALYIQHWSDANSRLQLADGVSKVKIIRGWKNATISTLDQGLIVAYIKSDKQLYYRNYCLQDNGELAWENERIVPTSSQVEDLNLFLTNDYRMGFVLELSTGMVQWLITGRNWGGMASPADKIVYDLGIDFNVESIKTQDLTYVENIGFNIRSEFRPIEPIYPELIACTNVDNSTIQLDFSHPIDNNDLTQLSSSFDVSDSNAVDYDVLSSSLQNGRFSIVLTCKNFGGSSGDLTVKYNSSILQLYTIKDGGKFNYNDFSISFTPTIISTIVRSDNEIIISDIDDVVFTPTNVNHINAVNGEFIDIQVIGIFDVIKVGTDPL